MNCEYNFVYLTLYHYTFILDYTLCIHVHIIFILIFIRIVHIVL